MVDYRSCRRSGQRLLCAPGGTDDRNVVEADRGRFQLDINGAGFILLEGDIFQVPVDITAGGNQHVEDPPGKVLDPEIALAIGVLLLGSALNIDQGIIHRLAGILIRDPTAQFSVKLCQQRRCAYHHNQKHEFPVIH